ncbi:MAG: diguanylate cyclase [Phycisphaerales bacterium]|jgi:diguanylate cyclase (GGDEF)-like protein|nr:diguanylate cyclase [Phycisphaerales bacterium]MDP6891450.1 diguanylate cyclase [Phycisphaerales bacterium]
MIDVHDSVLPEILIVEGDPEVAGVLVAAVTSGKGGGLFDLDAPQAGCVVVDSIASLHRQDLGRFGAALVASVMHDGCGLDVLAYLRGLAPDLPIVVVGAVADSSIAPEAIRGGACEFVLLTGHEHVTIPLAIRKAIVHRQLRQDNEQLQQTLTRSMAELAEMNRRLEQSVSRLEDVARTDDLTGLTNRRWLNIMLESRWAESERHELDLGFLMIDLDGFKGLNDSLGHHRGDDVLRHVAELLADTCREIDIAARYGGDEFCVLLPHADLDATLTVGRRIAERFRAATSEWGLAAGVLGVSIGAAHRSVSGAASPQELVRHADEAMYAAKKQGCHIMLRALESDGLMLVA